MEKKTNKLGIYSWYGFHMPLYKRLENIKKAGFDATMVWWGDEVAFWEASKEEIPSMVRNSGLYFENIHVPYEKCDYIWFGSTMERENMLKNYFTWIEDCAKYNIPIMVMHLTNENTLKEPNIKGFKAIEGIVKKAEECKIKVAVENTKNNALLDTIFAEIPSAWLGLCFDSSHERLHPLKKKPLLQAYGDRLFATHLSDNDGLEDRHWLPSSGSIDWNKLIDAFPKEYEGCISLEAFPKENEEISSEMFLAKAYEAVEKIHRLVLLK